MPLGTVGEVTKVASDMVHVVFVTGDAWQFEASVARESLETFK